MKLNAHQYVERDSGAVRSERPFGDWIVNYLYCQKRERAPMVYELLGSQWFSGFLGWINYDFPLGQNISGIRRFMKNCAIDLSECLDNPEQLDTARKVFERRIRYWQCRPMCKDEFTIVSPADSRIVLGSFKETSTLVLKGKFFDYEELLDPEKSDWLDAFRGGNFAICRLTPDKYHYNHTPVAGVVRAFYESDGTYHSCNPGAVLTLATPYSKNKRVITIIDTDVTGGTHVGLVAMIEVVALMIGDIAQRYSDEEYHHPRGIEAGMFLRRGSPKSLFRPGSSTTVLLFQENRVEFASDLMRNLCRAGVESRYSLGLGRPLVETEVRVRSPIGRRTLQIEEMEDDSYDF
ncbi:MAG TPA: phosphatidylserine decarboxylase [Candidatus Binatia bacterium]